MNKQALKLKKQRRALREQEKQLKKEALWDEMTESAKLSGLPPLEKTQAQMEKVYRATKQIDNEVMVKTAIVSLVCSLKTLKDKFDYTKADLLRYSKFLRDFIIHFTSAQRPLLKIIGELEEDYDIPLTEKCKSLTPLNDNTVRYLSKSDTIIKATHSQAYYFIGMNAYAFMNDYAYNFKVAWNRETLEIFIDNLIELFDSILIDTSKLIDYNKEMLESSEIDVNLNTGTVREIY